MNQSHFEIALVLLAGGSIAYLVLVFLTVWKSPSLELGLIALGLLSGVIAVWAGMLQGTEGVSVQAKPGQPGAVGLAFGPANGAGIMGRIAVLLVLGGLAIIFFGRWSASAAATREEAPRANPS